VAHLALDAFDDSSAWSATAPGGGASALVTVSDATGPRPGAGGVRFVIGGGAAGHRVERAVAAADLGELDDLQLSVRSDRVLSPDDGFAVELALGSVARPVDAPTNTWRRLVPAPVPRRWQTALVTVTDLIGPVRSAVTRIRLTVVTDEPCTVELSGLGAVRYDLLGDVEAALVDRLDQVVTVDGTPARAVVAPDAPPGPAGAAHLRIRPLAVRPAPERDRTASLRTDFTATGFALRPSPEPVDLDYAVDAVADDRAGQRALVEAIVEHIPPVGRLLVLDRPHTLEWTGPLGVAGDPPVPSASLRVATARRSTAAPTPAVPPFNEVRVEVDHDA
jgi:hypothetical protein